ncbi:hypothetical protein OHC33_007317 [Knufia fluminis]|uniref:F-box domain-containing protein n=1 Tax=Knufia fluminis TaxID=191047 RepID=A0AAN8EHG9_9EURO|nr:hypothetical protein OHC33_007317 [Knufia fluminis]
MGFFNRALFSSASESSRASPQLSETSSESRMELAQHADQQPRPPTAPILKLPPEIIQHILSFLNVQHLQSLYRTCHDFKTHVEDEQLWLPLLKASLPDHDVPPTPHPAPSYRHLYLSHHPHWFLPHHRIWFSDDAYNGKLILIKYNPATATISGYRLAAERPPTQPQLWSIKPSVIIHQIEPRVYVSTDDPVLHLTYPFSSETNTNTWTPQTETPMRVGRPEQKINASLMLSKTLPESTANTPSVIVWPPRTIPSMPRTRSSTGNNSSNSFMAKGHKPSTIDEISTTTFRLRTWSHFTQGMRSLGVRVGEEVSTWSTLDTSLYTPSATKPYQGLFVGDYAAHGCEFLLVLQTERAPRYQREAMGVGGDGGEEEGGGTRRANYIQAVLAALREQQFNDEEDEADEPGVGMEKTAAGANGANVQGGNVSPNVADPDGSIHRGSIEAIKITGDVNVPRGEHTFIADDIGPDGTIRIAHEEPFRGARVVRSRGHVAARGFRDDEFIPSQLFLINPDLLAQYWLPFGHISFYKRIDVDELMRGVAVQRRMSE